MQYMYEPLFTMLFAYKTLTIKKASKGYATFPMRLHKVWPTIWERVQIQIVRCLLRATQH